MSAFPLGQLLTGKPSAPINRDDEAPTSKAGKMRAAIQEHGSMNARQLCVVAGVADSGKVMALLKNDLATGRINFACGIYTPGKEPLNGVTLAIALLKRAGYVVTLNGRAI